MKFRDHSIHAGPRRSRVSQHLLAGAGSLLLAASVAGCGGSSLAKVGNDTITDKQFVDVAVKSGAATSIITSLVVMDVIDQEARAKNVAPSDEDVSKYLSNVLKEHPEAQKQVDEDRAQILQQVRLQLGLNNLMAQGTDMSDAKKQQWFNSHKSLFDLPATYSGAVFVFDNMDIAKKARALLAQNSSSADVAKLGSATFPSNGQPTPAAPKDQFVQMLGVPNTKYVEPLTSPSAKPGMITDIIPNLMQKKPGFIRLVSSTPPKTANYADNVDKVQRYMGVEAYAQTKLHINIPPGLSGANYNELAQNASQQFVRELVSSYFDKNKITIKDTKTRDAIKAQFKPPAAAPAGAMGSPAGMQSAPVDMQAPPGGPGGPQ